MKLEMEQIYLRDDARLRLVWEVQAPDGYHFVEGPHSMFFSKKEAKALTEADFEDCLPDCDCQ